MFVKLFRTVPNNFMNILFCFAVNFFILSPVMNKTV